MRLDLAAALVPVPRPKHLMPDFEPPWVSTGVQVREDYAAGVWAYAVGKPAWKHREYKTACRLAEESKFNPWWVRSVADVHFVLDGGYFHEPSGQYAVDYFAENLVHSIGRWAGEPFVLMDWQVFDVQMPLFGWMRHNDIRRYTRGGIWIPKKNGKSTWAAGIAVLLLDGDDEPGAEVYAAAIDREQAGIVFSEAKRMVNASQELTMRLKVVDSTKRVKGREDEAAIFRALSAEIEQHEGLNIHGAIVDEIHVHKTDALWKVLYHGGASRVQPLLFSISTAGVWDETSIGLKQYKAAKNIMEGVTIDSSFFAYVCEAEKKADWKKEETWKRANPSYDLTITAEGMRDMCKDALNDPENRADFWRYRLNRWTNARSPWMNLDKWERCKARFAKGERAKYKTLKAKFEEELKGEVCYGGLDMSLSEDITALVLWFPPTEDRLKHRYLAWFWIPNDNVEELGEANAASYTLWRDDGLLTATPGNWIDDKGIIKTLGELRDVYDIKSVGFDRWGSKEVVRWMVDEELDCQDFGQGFKDMNSPTKALKGLVYRKEMEHYDCPIMRWMLSNCQQTSDEAGNVKLVKGIKATGKKQEVRFKIDGVIAAIMGLGTSVMVEEEGPSVYETRGVLHSGG